VSDLAAARQRFAELLASSAQLRSRALIAAFAAVPRERFLGPGPWQVLESVPFEYRPTPDDDPVHLYRDLPVAIDASRLLNNGQPSFVAALIDALDLRRGDRVVHVGCGTGYYTAVIAEVVGPRGSVAAVEIDPDLAARARQNLASYAQVRVVCADGGTHGGGDADAIFVNAGATHPRARWIDRLDRGGRLVLPLVRWPSAAGETGPGGTGVVVKIVRHAAGASADVLMSCMVFPCLGALDRDADRALGEAFARMAEADGVRSLRRDAHPREPECWLHGRDYCLSARARIP
jgi:protein-L-isoaspartate(D-aspartate) O-methyltransferase